MWKTGGDKKEPDLDEIFKLISFWKPFQYGHDDNEEEPYHYDNNGLVWKAEWIM